MDKSWREINWEGDEISGDGCIYWQGNMRDDLKVMTPVLSCWPRSKYWWYGSRGWIFPPTYCYILFLWDMWQQRGNLTKWCLTQKCVWSKGVSLNLHVEKNCTCWHSLLPAKLWIITKFALGGYCKCSHRSRKNTIYKSARTYWTSLRLKVMASWITSLLVMRQGVATMSRSQNSSR